jgi:hypothetical protein
MAGSTFGKDAVCRTLVICFTVMEIKSEGGLIRTGGLLVIGLQFLLHGFQAIYHLFDRVLYLLCRHRGPPFVL